ncbi:hypothetical protein TNCV_5081441 [Trichonephila clavipes]|nr:hypothetical protein TNCV_5081441 [Trichonephila clavipes]
MYSVFVKWRGSLNSLRATSYLARLVERKKRWEAPDQCQGVVSQNCGETQQNCTAICTTLKAKDNDRRNYLAHSRDEFRGPRSDVMVDRNA